MTWTPRIVKKRLECYRVVLVSTNGRERTEVMVLAPTMEDAEKHAQAQHPTMHVVDSWEFR